MPITDGPLNEPAQQTMFAELTASSLAHHELAGNTFLTPNVIGEVATIPREKSFAGGKPADIAIVELKVPSFALASPAQRAGFAADATAIVQRATAGRLPADHIWVNMVYTVDGLWGIGGRAVANDQLLQAAGAAA